MEQSKESKRSNPARRLLVLLQLARKADPNQKTSEVWTRLLHATTPGDFTRRYAEVLRMPALIQVGIRQISGIRHELYLRWVPHADTLFSSLNFVGPWVQSKDYINESLLNELEFCDEALSRSSPEECVEEDQLKEILTDTKSLFDEVRGADISEELKQFMLRHLYEIEKAIEDYWVIGPNPLRSACEAAVTNIAFDADIRHRASQTKPGQRLWKILSRISIILGLYTGPAQLGKDVVPFLLPPGEVKQGSIAEPAQPDTPCLEHDKKLEVLSCADEPNAV